MHCKLLKNLKRNIYLPSPTTKEGCALIGKISEINDSLSLLLGEEVCIALGSYLAFWKMTS